MGFYLNRKEVVSLLLEILSACGDLGEQAVILMPPYADDVLSHGYQLHIKPNIDPERLACVEPIVQKRGLAIETKKGLTIIYNPA